ncbi:MAG: hypothetical protein HOL85_00275 [Rhodospirillaceae bacterium]|nr:hypothetical protein [Rhodospirillaceae bacterium]
MVSVFLVVLTIAWKTLATAAIVISAGRLAARAGPLLTSVLITIPVNAGPGFFFISLEADEAFLSHGGLVAFSITGSVLMFSSGYIHGARFFSFLPSLLTALVAWGIATYVTLLVEPSLVWAMVVNIDAVLFAWLLRRRLPPPTRARPMPAAWRYTIIRGGLAGLVVAGVATASPFLGPAWSGILLGFPTIMVASAWMLAGHYGQAFTAATMQASQRTIISYASFCLSLHLLAGPLPGTIAVLASFGIAIGCAFLLAIYIHYFSSRS